MTEREPRQTASFRGLNCPNCSYSLEGLPHATCPECGKDFGPDWLYSVDYAHAFQWTRRRQAIAWVLGAGCTAGILILAARAGPEYVCLLFSVLGIGAVVLMRRLIQ